MATHSTCRRARVGAILQSVRWYLRYSLSYLEKMLEERGVYVDHTSIFRWVHRCVGGQHGFAGLVYLKPAREAGSYQHFCAVPREALP